MQITTELQLGVVCCLMFFGAWVFGIIPLQFRQNSNIIQPGEGTIIEWMSCLGAGMLISTVFTIIIPEGMDAFSHQSENEESFPEWTQGAALLAGFITLMALETLQSLGNKKKRKDSTSPPPDVEDVLNAATAYPIRDSQPHNHGGHCGHMEGGGAVQAIVGLVIHSIADGLAVGVASLSENQDLNFAVGVAMVLHRGPVAFGLGSYLSKVHYPLKSSQQGILAFAAASPIAAVVTHFGLGYLPVFRSGGGVALCILFSGGSFLFAACMHILPEINAGKSPQLNQLGIMMIGVIGPLLFSMWHSHGHSHEIIHHGHDHDHDHNHEHRLLFLRC